MRCLTVCILNHAIDHTGEVYLPIPRLRSGKGKIHILIDDSLKELDAITEGEQIMTGTRIKVLKVLKNNVMLVEALDHNSGNKTLNN